MPAARRPIVGADKVARFLIGIAHKAKFAYELRASQINRQPGFIIVAADRPVAVFVLDVADQFVQAIHLVANPAKLQALSSKLVTE